MSLLIYFPGFLGPFTYSLSLIIPMGLLLHFLGFLSPFTLFFFKIFFFTSFYSCGPVGHQSCHFSLLGLLLCSFSVFTSHFLHIVGLFLLLGPLSKVGINIQPPEHMDCSCNSYANTYAVFFCGLFHNSCECFSSFLHGPVVSILTFLRQIVLFLSVNLWPF